ncbi:LysR family transcriptional regulator [Thalassobacillus hwangdonensis]|uniref:LysR family transcriptional regulator n=1 Tax=Thalassobacillus hwangdonensis TaxID=546108 RepID=A0ABW3L437_9BACI
MKIDDYKLLVTLKQAGTIREASQRLYISQPAVSQRLKQLEESWGEKIFLRTYKSLILTPIGEKIIQFAEEVLQKENDLIQEISSISDEVRGSLSLGISSVVGQYLLPEVLRDYMEQYPKVKINLVTGLSSHIEETMSDYHLSIIRGKQPKQQPERHLFSDRLYLIAKKESMGKNVLIEFKSDHTFHSMVKEWFLEHHDFTPDQTIKVDQIEICKQMMTCGVGMAVLPELAIKDLDKNDFDITPLKLGGSTLTRDTWICLTKQAEELPQVRAFQQLLEKHIKKQG